MNFLQKFPIILVVVLLVIMSILGGASTALAVDPNCTVNVAAGAAIPNYYGAPNAVTRKDASDAIAQLVFANMYRNPPFRINQGNVRLDVQGGVAGGGRNWQVQVNGVSGNSTIAAAIIDGNLANASTPQRRRNVERSFRNALVQSLTNATIYTATGPCN